MKKILVINYGSKPLPDVKGGGVENLIQLYINYINQYKKNIDMTVVSYYDLEAKKKSKEYANINFIYIKKTLFFKIFQSIRYLINKYMNIYIGNEFIHKCRKKIIFNDYDIIISENGIDFGRYIKKYYNGKIVLHLHNDFLNSNTKNVDKILRGYDEIWTLSKFVKDRVKEVNNKVNVKVLYNGVDLSLFNKKKYSSNGEIIRKKYGLENNEKIFIYCGRIVEEKGVYELVEAFNNVCKKYSKIKLLIIGSYNSSDEYYNKVKEISNDYVVFTNYVKHDDLPAVLSIGFCGIAPTVHLEKNYIDGNYCGVIEGFNLTVIEYLGMGIPVIISNSGGMPELINKQSGTIVSANEKKIVNELENAIYMMIDKRENYKESDLLQRANVFSKDNYVNTFNKYVEELYD